MITPVFCCAPLRCARLSAGAGVLRGRQVAGGKLMGKKSKKRTPTRPSH